jgi:polar amino acid transport system substrate-binding protein
MRRVAIAFIALWFALALVVSAQPGTETGASDGTSDPTETVLEKVTRSGVLTAGTRTDASPFAYIDAQGNWVGFSVDLLHLIQAGLQDQLQRPVQLSLVETNVADWASKLEKKEIDIVCGSTSITTGRGLRADFSVGYFRTGTQFLIKKAHVLSPPELKIGVVRGASNEYPIENQLRLAKLTRFANRAEGLKALVAGQIDALASDGILLEGLRQTLPDAETFEIIPRQPFSPESYGCALPQNDPAFKALVNRELIAFMQNVLSNDGQAVALFETWFGTEGVAPVDRAQILAYFRETIATYEQNLGEQNPGEQNSGSSI